MSSRTQRKRGLVQVALVLGPIIALAAVAAGVAAGAKPSRPSFTARAVDKAAVVSVPKSSLGRLAQSDPALLNRTDGSPVRVLIKLDYDAVASYEGTIEGLPPTSPKVTGRKLHANRDAVTRYLGHVARVESAIISAIESSVSGEKLGQSYQVAYGGVSMTLPANEVGDLLAVDGVVAVQQDRMLQPQTDATPAFLGAASVWPSLGGPNEAGEGVIVGILDTGVWPEHPSFDDPGITYSGPPVACEFEGISDPQLGAPFECNDKLIGAYAFTEGYLSAFPALDDEFCNNTTKQCSPRDADGHGTHTASTAAGSPVAQAVLLGVDRGAISGIAPGAHLIGYRVCLDQGCFQSDSVAAVQQAILDGVDVLNFSISGGNDAYSDPVELAFLEAYAAGIIVNASAGNDGPDPSTVAHTGPWTNTVGASTSNRHFVTTLQLAAANGDTFRTNGVTVTAGVANLPVAIAASTPGYMSEPCLTEAAPGTLVAKAVLCIRGTNARVEKGYNVLQGGAAAMILVNPGVEDVETDNHWLPAIHLDGPPTDLLAFIEAHSGVTASWLPGTATAVTPDVMAAFSSRGPAGDFIKPDVTAPGVQILAGMTPDPVDANITLGPPGQLYQAIAGTSMSSPHAAGVSALVKAAHPDWTPGQIKSALMTSSVQTVLKEDGVTPADPFDRGAGSIRADRAVSPTATFDVTAAEYAASSADPLNRVHLNLPSIDVPAMSGSIKTRRTLKNVSGQLVSFTASISAPAGSTITVKPRILTLAPGGSGTIEVTIDGTRLARDTQYFGQITLMPTGGLTPVVLPVAFYAQQGSIQLENACDPTTIRVATSTLCSAKATNLSAAPAEVSIRVESEPAFALGLRSLTQGTTWSLKGFSWKGTLSPALAPPVASVGPGELFGYVSLSALGVPAETDFEDETIVNYSVPELTVGTETYDTVGVVSNGYVVLGGGGSADVNFVPQTFPDPDPPNNVLAPFWTDLDPSAGGGIRIAVLSDGPDSWLVVDWEQVPVFSSGAARTFQIWLQLNAEDITYAYGPVGAGDPEGLAVGAENRDGTSGQSSSAVPTGDLRIVFGSPAPGGSVKLDYRTTGRVPGAHEAVASLDSNVTSGTTREAVKITVTP